MLNYEIIDNVKVIDFCDLCEELFGSKHYTVDQDTVSEAVAAWMEARGAHYHASDDKYGYVYDAADAAIAVGKTTVVAEYVG